MRIKGNKPNVPQLANQVMLGVLEIDELPRTFRSKVEEAVAKLKKGENDGKVQATGAKVQAKPETVTSAKKRKVTK